MSETARTLSMIVTARIRVRLVVGRGHQWPPDYCAACGRGKGDTEFNR
jgi:hypothetical protein